MHSIHCARLRLLSLAVCVFTGALPPTYAQGDDQAQLAFTRSHYNKNEYRIPMRDGVKLFTAVYVPRDQTQPHPILLERTPYSISPYGADNYRAVLGPTPEYEKEGFIVVYQDVRGRHESEGLFVDNPVIKDRLTGPKDIDETSDTYDTIDWLLKNVPNNNGRVGMWGISYPGMFAAFGLIRSHPALKAVSPQAPMGDVGNGDDAYHNGAFFLAANFDFYTGFHPRGLNPTGEPAWPDFSYGTPDAYEFFLRMDSIGHADSMFPGHHNSYWTDTLLHPNYDAFWASRAIAPHLRHITPAVLFVGGWFDAEDLAGPLKLFRAADQQGEAPSLTLVMGPWRHGGWAHGAGDRLGNLRFNNDTGAFFRDQIELPFFRRYLMPDNGVKGSDSPAKFPKAWVFETGSNHWRQFDAWPPAAAQRRSLYLTSAGGLGFAPSTESGCDEYTSDPAKPVPVTSEIGEGMPGDYLTRDQRFASRRPDVLTYKTPPLDHDLTIAGPVNASLRVATSGTDSDFIVKLIDVYPDNFPNPNPNPTGIEMGGYQQIVRGEPFRGKFRRDMAHPEPFRPGAPDWIQFAMPDVFHTFRAGHSIMVQIQSSWFPLVDRNPQRFENIPTARNSDFQKAIERVYYGGRSGTRLDVLVLP